MKRMMQRSPLLALLAGAALAAGCTTVLLPANETPVVPLTHSLEQAASKLADVKAERAAVELAYGDAEQICYTKFFVNDCLDKAKEQRRSALAYLRAVEVEAEYYQRKDKADQRDRAVEVAVKQFEAEEARLAAQPAVVAPVADGPSLPPPKPALAARKAERAVKQARQAAQDAADAPKRAASAAEFEQRKRDAEKRQQRVAERMAERAAKAERQKAAKAEEAAKLAAQKAAREKALAPKAVAPAVPPR